MIYYLYLATRSDGEKYVGITNNPIRREWQHRNGYGSSELKGRDFVFEVLEEGTEEQISSLEASAIKGYNASLNKIVGGKFGHGLKGSTNGRAKLTEQDVYIIKCLAADGVTQKELASRYGVSRQTVGGICTGANWKHVPGPVTSLRKIVDTNTREIIINLSKSGVSNTEIAKMLGIKYATVYLYTKEIQ